jgi:hypothetical protein
VGLYAPLIERYIMYRNIESYLKVYNDFLTPKECKKVIQDLKKSDDQFVQHSYHNILENREETHDDDLSVSYVKIPFREEMMKRTWNLIHTYISDFDYRWFDRWTGFSDIRFNKYEVGKYMKIHADHIQTLFDGQRKGIPILSIVGILNDDYEGGEFMFWEDTEIKVKSGDIVVFPSCFLYPHFVKPVTKGTRYSYVSWVW